MENLCRQSRRQILTGSRHFKKRDHLFPGLSSRVEPPSRTSRLIPCLDPERPAHLVCFPCWVQLHFHDPRALQSCLLYKSWYSNAFIDIAKQRIFAWSTYPDLEVLLKWKVLLAAYHTTLSFQSRSLHCSGLYFQWRPPSCMFSYKGLIHFLEPRNR